MFKIRTSEKYYKFIPLISCILLIISFLAPVAGDSYFGIYTYYWIWGLVTAGLPYPYNESETAFVNTAFNSPLPLVISIICSLYLLAMAVNLLKLYSKLKNGLPAEHSLKNTGIIIITMMVIYAIIMDVSYNIYLNDLISSSEEYLGLSYSYTNFWTTLGVGFGFVLPFISGGLSIMGFYVIRYYSRRDHIISREPANKYTNPLDMYIPPIPTKEDIKDKSPINMSVKTNFCSECGSKIHEGNQFCPQCGFKL